MSASTSDKDDQDISSSSFSTYLTAQAAYDLDQELMAPGKFTLEQLMELAGLAVAQATFIAVLDDKSRQSQQNNDAPLSPLPPSAPSPRVLVVCGPGNNGGDGLVAARHLTLFGCHVDIVYPKQPSLSKQPHYARLVEQCRDAGVTNILPSLPPDLNQYHAMVDAIFGFSFHGEPREPFKSILRYMTQAQEQYGTLIVSVDVPSGWNVNDGPVGIDDESAVLQPDVLISLTAPKPCAQYLGQTNSSISRPPVRHFVGGRFVPPALAAKYHLVLPTYPGMSQIVEVTSNTAATTATTTTTATSTKDYDWTTDYAAYLAEQEAAAAHNDNEPLEVTAASSSPPKEEDATTSWQEEYAAYCHAKETEPGEQP